MNKQEIRLNKLLASETTDKEILERLKAKYMFGVKIKRQ